MSKTMHMGDTTLEKLVMAKKRIKDMESQLKATVLIEQGYQDQIAELKKEVTEWTIITGQQEVEIAELGDKVKSQREHIIEITTYSKETLAKIKAQASRDILDTVPCYNDEEYYRQRIIEHLDKLEQDDG